MASFSNNFHQNSFLSSPIKLSIENLLPRAEIQFPIGYGNYYFPSHNLPLQMSISIILPIVVMVLRNRLMRSELLKPNIIVMMESPFIIVYENRGSYVHCVYKYQALGDPTFTETFLHLKSDIYKSSTGQHFK